MKNKNIYFIAIASFALISITSCGEEVKPKKEKNTVTEADLKTRLNGRFDNKLFSIPSPFQTSMLVKKLNLPFEGSILNPTANVNNYVTEHKQALNLGVYGADFGFAALYDEKAISMTYLTTIQKLSKNLNLDAAFNKSFFEKFEKSQGNGDAMLDLMTNAFADADFYLKDADRKPVTALILTGGWIESLHFAIQLNEKNDSPEIRKRISEQTRSLLSIIEILTEYNNEEKVNDELINSLSDLYNSFLKIKTEYEYVAPETDGEMKKTVLNPNVKVEMSSSLLKQISEKVSKIRSSIINA